LDEKENLVVCVQRLKDEARGWLLFTKYCTLYLCVAWWSNGWCTDRQVTDLTSDHFTIR